MNNHIFFFFYNMSHRSELFDKLVLFLAEPIALCMFAGIALYLVFEFNKLKTVRERLEKIALIFGPAVVALICAKIFKDIFAQPRPYIVFENVVPLLKDSSYAFPSGHATFFSAFALSTFFVHKKIGYIFGVCALLIGLARITAGVHFPVDILGGFILGIGVTYVVRFLYFKITKKA